MDDDECAAENAASWPSLSLDCNNDGGGGGSHEASDDGVGSVISIAGGPVRPSLVRGVKSPTEAILGVPLVLLL